MLKITQQQQIHQILDTVLGKKPCSILVDGAEHPAGFISYTLLTSGPELKIRTQFHDTPTERRVLVRHNKKRIVAVCKFLLRNGPTEILHPHSLEITDEVKKDIAETGNSAGFFLTNLTSAKEIAFVIEANKKKVNGFVLNFFDSELKGLVPYHRIFLATGESTDIRLRHLVKNPRIIYYTPEPPPGFRPKQYFPQDVYLAEIHKSDLKVPASLKTEFTIPILYKTRLPIGYIQINTPRAIDDILMQTVKKIGVALETQLRKIGLQFEESRALPVSKIDMHHIELEISDRLLLRHFQPGFVVLFRIQKQGESLGQFSAVVSKSTNLGGGKTQIVLNFQDNDAMSELNLEEALKG